MNDRLIIYGIIILALILLFLLLRYLIKAYFENARNRYDQNSRYISKVALFYAFLGFTILVGTPKIIELLVNHLVIPYLEEANQEKITPIQFGASWLEIIAYAIFMIGIAAIIFLSFRKTEQERQQRLLEKEAQLPTEVTPPPELPKENPIFHQRIHDLLQLKYPTKTFITKSLREHQHIIYTIQEDQWDIHVSLYYCDENIATTISAEKQAKIYQYLKNDIVPKLVLASLASDKKKALSTHYHYLLFRGDFEDFEAHRYVAQTEATFRQELVNFSQFKNYLTWLTEQFDTKKLWAAAENKTLKDTFVEPDFLIGEQKENQLNQSLKDYFNKWLTDNEERRHIVLLGDYGMGKSSFLKYYAWSLAQDILNGKTDTRLPVFIPLTNVSLLDTGIEKTIKAFVSDRLGIAYELFQRTVYDGRVVFILDGFDEMSFIGTREKRFEQFDKIWQLATQNNKLLLSGRPSYLEDQRIAALRLLDPERDQRTAGMPFAEPITLQRLSDNRIKSYIQAYYPEKIKLYFNWISSNDSFHDLCRRPALMHMIRVMLPDLYGVSGQQRIENAAGVIRQYIDFWFERQYNKKEIDTDRRISSAFKGSKEELRTFVITFFEDLFGDFFLQDISAMEREDILEKLRAKITKEQVLQDAEGNTELEKAYQDGLEREILTGYFVEEHDLKFKYVHKAFYEYFAAAKIVRAIRSSKKVSAIEAKEWKGKVDDFIFDLLPMETKTDEKVPAAWRLKLPKSVFLLNFIRLWDNYKFISKRATYLLSIRDLIYLLTLSIIVYNTLFYSIFEPGAAFFLIYIFFLISIQFLPDFQYKFFTLGSQFSIVKFYKNSIMNSNNHKQINTQKFIYSILNLLQNKRTNIIYSHPNFNKNAYFNYGFSTQNIKVNTYQLNKLENQRKILQAAIGEIAKAFYSKAKAISNKTLTWEKLKINNVKLDRLTFYDCNFIDCRFISVSFGNTDYFSCNFEKIELRDCKSLPIQKNAQKIGTNFSSSSSSKRVPIEYILRFENIQFDNTFITSLANFIKQNNLTLQQEVIIGDEALLKALTKELNKTPT